MKKLEVLQFIIFNCMLPFIISFVVTCILNADMCLDIVGDFIWFIKEKKESVHFWIWQKTHKDELIQKILNKEPTYEIPGWTADEVNERLKSWAMAIEDIGETYREGIESWGEALVYVHSEREE